MKRTILCVAGALAAVGALSACNSGGYSHGAAPPASNHHSTRKPNLTVKITTTSTTWGTVRITMKTSTGATKKVGTCSRSSCSYRVPKNRHLTFKQTPVDTATWPFKDWTVHHGSHSSTAKGSTLRLIFSGKNTVVTAVYILK